MTLSGKAATFIAVSALLDRLNKAEDQDLADTFVASANTGEGSVAFSGTVGVTSVYCTKRFAVTDAGSTPGAPGCAGRRACRNVRRGTRARFGARRCACCRDRAFRNSPRSVVLQMSKTTTIKLLGLLNLLSIVALAWLLLAPQMDKPAELNTQAADMET